MELKEKVRGYIEENLIVFDEDVTLDDDTNIFEMGFVNSLFAMKLLNFIEAEFAIEIDTDDMDMVNFSSINNIESLILKKLA